MLHRRVGGENVFQGKIIEVHIGTLLADQAFTFTDWTAEMKAKASICISKSDTLIESLKIAKSRRAAAAARGLANIQNFTAMRFSANQSGRSQKMPLSISWR